MTASDPQTDAEPEAVAARALELAGGASPGRVTVAGPGALAAMLGLCRAGCEEVQCAADLNCAASYEPCDLLLIVGALAPAELAETVRRTGRLLRDGGRLAVQARRPEDAPAIRTALAAVRLEAEVTLVDRSPARLLVLAVRRAPPLLEAG